MFDKLCKIQQQDQILGPYEFKEQMQKINQQYSGQYLKQMINRRNRPFHPNMQQKQSNNENTQQLTNKQQVKTINRGLSGYLKIRNQFSDKSKQNTLTNNSLESITPEQNNIISINKYQQKQKQIYLNEYQQTLLNKLYTQ